MGETNMKHLGVKIGPVESTDGWMAASL